jgi:hypothetical protein
MDAYDVNAVYCWWLVLESGVPLRLLEDAPLDAPARPAVLSNVTQYSPIHPSPLVYLLAS